MTPIDTEQLLAFDREHLWHPYASMSNPPPAYAVVAAHGVRLQLADGRELIDGMASWWSAIHGYNHPALNAAATAQLDDMAHVMFGGITHPAAVGLGQRLLRMVPDTLDKIFFSDSGSVAVEVAIKMALQYWISKGEPQRCRLLTVNHGYHGDTFATMAVCDPINGMHHLFKAVLPHHLFAPAPQPRYHETFNESDIADFTALLHQHKHDIAAVILEPIAQGAGGMRFYAPDYLRRVRELCDEFGILLILDEIATGFARTGKLFAHEHAAITPDILCLGKAMTGGYLSLAATLCTTHVNQTIESGAAGVLMHGPTFMANPLACRIASASIDTLLASDWQTNIRRIEVLLEQGLAPARDCKKVADVRVLGAIGVIELHQAVDLARIQRRFVDAGVWVRPFGKLVYIMPPYIISDEDLLTLTSAMVQVVACT
jgi:adenosylmethionine-8-amino-7-oxononanoate aminotransferase